MADPHAHYDRLDENERAFVDALMGSEHAYRLAKEHGIALATDDRAERATDALAALVIASRERVPDFASAKYPPRLEGGYVAITAGDYRAGKVPDDAEEFFLYDPEQAAMGLHPFREIEDVRRLDYEPSIAQVLLYFGRGELLVDQGFPIYARVPRPSMRTA